MNTWLKSIAVGLVAGLIVFFLSAKSRNAAKAEKFAVQYVLGVEQNSETEKGFSVSDIMLLLHKRLDAGGYDFVMEEKGRNRINVTIKNISDTARPRRILTTAARLQFRELYTMSDAAIMNMLSSKVFRGEEIIVEERQGKLREDNAHKRDTSLADDLPAGKEPSVKIEGGIYKIFEITQFPYQTVRGINTYPGAMGNIKEKDKDEFLRFMNSEEVKTITPADMEIFFGQHIKGPSESKEKKLDVYFIRTLGAVRAKIENEEIVEASARFNQMKNIEIVIQMNQAGKRTWAEMTKANTGKPIAMIIDDEVLTAPNVNEPITDGTTVITGNYTIEEANDLAKLISAPRFPAKVSVLSYDVVAQKTSSSPVKVLLIPFIAFLAFTGIAFALFKSLKTT